MNGRELRAPLFGLLTVWALAGRAVAQPAGPSSSQPAPAGELFAPIDRELLDLDTRLTVIERQVAATGSRGAQPRDIGSDCPAKATPSYIVANFQDLVHDPEAMNPNDALAGILLDYFQCEALTSGRVSACQGARGVFDTREVPREIAPVCQEHVSISLIFRALLQNGADFQQLCTRYLRPESPQVTMARVCAVLGSHWQNPSVACPQIATLLGNDGKKIGQECMVQLQGLISGDAGPCSAMSGPNARQDCETTANFSRAYRTRNPSFCADDLRCHTMMQSNAGYCVGYARQAARSYCRINQILAQERRIDSWNSVRDVSVAFQQFAAVRDSAVPQIRSELENIDLRLRPEDRELAMQVDDRYARLTSIEMRSERLAPKLITHPPRGK